jgi:hypothetical protein
MSLELTKEKALKMLDDVRLAIERGDDRLQLLAFVLFNDEKGQTASGGLVQWHMNKLTKLNCFYTLQDIMRQELGL